MTQAPLSTSPSPQTPRTASSRPCVVIVNDNWDCFDQLAHDLHRRGVRVHYLVVAPSRNADLRRRIVAPWSTRLADLSHLPQALAAIDSPHDVVDMVVSDGMLPAAIDAARRAGLRDALVADLERRQHFSDKRVLAEALDAAGLPSPTTIALTPDDADALDRQLGRAALEIGYPLLVKEALTAGGLSVRVVGSESEARATIAEFGGDLIAQRLIDGHNLRSALCYTPDGTVLQMCTYDTTRVDPTATTAPTAATVVTDARMDEVAAGVARVIGGYGLLNVETMCDETGPYVIDLNIRPFGTLSAWRQAGVDFVGAYLAALGLAPAPASKHLPDDTHIEVYPHVGRESARVHGAASGVREVAKHSFHYGHWLGARYALGAAVVVLHGLRDRRHAVRDRVPVTTAGEFSEAV